MKLVIVGGVAGGASAAARARRLSEDSEIVLFERGEDISFANCGLPYHIGNVISKRDNLLIMTPERFKARTNIDVRVRQEVTAIDCAKRALTVLNRSTNESHEETFDKLILATGASPIIPEIAGVDNPAVRTLWTLSDMDRIRSSVEAGILRAVVVGGGFLGLEVAENLCRREIKVTLVEMSPQLMPPLDPEMAVPLRRELERNGVSVILNNGITAIRRSTPPVDSRPEEVMVELRDGRSLPADLVVLATGVRPNSTLAKSAGLKIGRGGGIVVNHLLQTSRPDIYAVGDVIEVADSLGIPAQIPLAGPANKQGRIAAENIFGAKLEYKSTFGTSVVKLFELTAACTGATEKALQHAGVAYKKVYLHPYSHAKYYPGAQRMHLKLLFSMQGGILGAQLVGRDGVDKRIDVLATAMQAGQTVHDLQDLELAYAPPYSSAKDPVNFAGYVAVNLLSGKTDVVHADAIPEHALLLDVRKVSEFKAGGLPGAQLIPLGAIRERLCELPHDREIVVYCAVGIRGYLAERILKQHGFRARNLSGGYTTWQLFHPEHDPKSPATSSPVPGTATRHGSGVKDDGVPTPCGPPIARSSS